MKTISRSLLAMASTATLVAFAACGKETEGTCAEELGCGKTDASADGVITDGPPPVDAPPGCDANAEPKDAPLCVVDSFGVFVDATGGNDTNPGTKASPLKTLGAALGKLAGKPRIYVCEGTYPERITLTSAASASLYGGFACGAWTYNASKPKVTAPADNAGPALLIDKVTSSLVIADMAFASAPGTEAATSSIAAFVDSASSVRFVRSKLDAALGFQGHDGAPGVTGTPDKALDGISAAGTTAGALTTCTCSSGGTTSGGGGGPVNGDGQNGAPNIPENPTGMPTPKTGKGGLNASTMGCVYPGGLGLPGADAAPKSDALSITSPGAFTAAGWTPEPGKSGDPGLPGQGGGGGGGRAGAGGGGACGGCGGTGGKGGGGGGASIALLSRASTVTLVATTLSTAGGGKGGAGGGGGGGGAGSGSGGGCGGGDGGKGGDGGAGGGGAGGLSVGLLYKGPRPSLDPGSLVTTGPFGPKGQGGKPGTNDGLDGTKADALEVP